MGKVPENPKVVEFPENRTTDQKFQNEVNNEK